MTKVIINGTRTRGTINKNIYGHFAEHLGRCIYGGIYVGEESDIPNVRGIRTDIVQALKELKVPVLRWPGGCFADDYHWRDGIGDKQNRPYMVNTNWGGVVENNHFGTHEFFDFCEMIDTEPYICGNVGSGTVQEMRDWIEYMTFDGASPLADERRRNGREQPWKLKYFGVGNESWGCGGNMRPEYYADLYRRYSTFIRDYGEEPVYKIACGPNNFDTDWTQVVMREAGNHMNGISLHYYTIPNDTWEHKGDSLAFDEAEWYRTMQKALKMEDAVSAHSTIMDMYDPERKVNLIVDEWGTWFDVIAGTNPGFLYQQNTMRDALVAMVTLHIFHNHCNRITMANIAQLVNVLQAVILTEGEKMLLTPTYHIMRMMNAHQDAQCLDIDYNAGDTGADTPKISVSASKKDDAVTVSMCNISLDSAEDITLELRDLTATSAAAELLTSSDMRDCNTFDSPETVTPQKADVTLNDGGVSIKLPPMSAAVITLR